MDKKPSLFQRNRKAYYAVVVLIALAVLAVCFKASAATITGSGSSTVVTFASGDDTFAKPLVTFKNWIEGTYGGAATMMTMLVGIIMAIKGSLMGLGTAALVAVGANVGPDVVLKAMGAVI